MCPTFCDDSSEMSCWASHDANGCERPGFCVPAKSPHVDNQGQECPAFCPEICNDDQMYCPKGTYNGCPEPGYCQPKTSTFFLTD